MLWLLTACTLLDPCEGLDPDGDGVCHPDDCDSTDPDAFPGNDEVADGVDNDCDGLVDEDDTAADDTVTHTVVSALPDSGDLIVGLPNLSDGQLLQYTDSLDAPAVVLGGLTEGGRLGSVIAPLAGGCADLAVAGDGVVYLLTADRLAEGLTSAVSVPHAALSLSAHGPGLLIGTGAAVVVIEDTCSPDEAVTITGNADNGTGAAVASVVLDGVRHAAVGSPDAHDAAGRVTLLPPDATTIEESTASVIGGSPGDALGASLLAVDVDGDGHDDLAVGAPGFTQGALPEAGGAWVLSGAALAAASGVNELGDLPHARVTGGGDYERLGTGLAADGDRLLLVGCATCATDSIGAGGAWAASVSGWSPVVAEAILDGPPSAGGTVAATALGAVVGSTGDAGERWWLLD